MLLSGAIPPPDWAQPLVSTLESCTGMPGNHRWVQDALRNDRGYAFNGMGSPKAESPSFLKKKGRTASGNFPPESWGQKKGSGSYFESRESLDQDFNPPKARVSADSRDHPPVISNNSLPSRLESRAPAFETHFDSDYVPDQSIKMRPKSQLIYNPTPQSPSQPVHRRAESNPYFPPTGDLLDFDPLGPESKPSASQGGSYSHNPFNTTQSPTRSSSVNASDPFSAGVSALSLDDDPVPSVNATERPGHGRKPTLSFKPELLAPLPPGAVGRAIAMYNFAAAEPGDLGFQTGQVITIMQKSASTNDWCVPLSFYSG
jgi:SH3 domain-containing YSC84-like protein 1